MVEPDIKEVCGDGDFKLMEYSPTLLKPLYLDFEPMSLIRRIRFFLEYLGKDHYRVFYLKKTKN